MGKVETTGEAFGEGGSGYENVREILCGGGARGAYVWVQDMDNGTLAGESPQGFPSPGGMADVRHGPQTSMGWDMSLPTHWGSAGSGGYG